MTVEEIRSGIESRGTGIFAAANNTKLKYI